MPAADFAKILGTVFSRVEQKAQEQEAKTDKEKQEDIQMYRKVLLDPESSPEQRQKAAGQIDKLRGMKGKESPFQKLAGLLNHISSKAKSSPQGGAAPASPTPSGTGGLPGLEEPQKPPAQPQLSPGQKAIGEKAIAKVGHGLGAGLSAIGNVFNPKPQTLPPLTDAAPTAEQIGKAEGEKEKAKRDAMRENQIKQFAQDLREAVPGITDEEVKKAVETKFGGMPKSPKSARFGAFVPDPKSPTGYSRNILDGLSLLPTGEKDYGIPPGYMPKYHEAYKVKTNEDGSQELVKVTTTSGGVTPNKELPGKPGKTGGKGGSSGIPFGHKPLDAMSRRALVAADQASDGVDRISGVFDQNPSLKTDNNPITPAIDWAEYQHGHFEPSDPVRSQLIKEAALVGITASGLYSQGRMSRYLFDKAQQHLPQPNDSPQLLYSKIQWLKDNHILDDMKADIKDPFREKGNTGANPYAGKRVMLGDKEIIVKDGKWVFKDTGKPVPQQ